MTRGLQAGFRLGDYEVKPDAGELHGASGISVLHPQTMKLLVFLAEHAGELITSRRLAEDVWPHSSVSDETVRRCLKELRYRLHEDPLHPAYIESCDDQGHRLIAPVTPSQSITNEAPSPVQRVIGELKRRKVFRVVAAYTVVSWLLLQVADVLSEVPWLPDNALTILVILVASGFPIVIVLAWWLEITDQGVVLDPETADRWPNMARVWRPIAIGGALAIAAGISAFLLTREEFWAEERVAAAVLPFDDLSAAGAERSCGWLTEELTDSLANVRELRIAARTSAEALAGASLQVPEIAERLRVNYILEGSCGADNDRLRITAQLIEAEQGFHLWSQVYDVPWTERLKVVGEIARRVTETLDIKLSEESERRLHRIPTTSEQAYVSYQQGRRYLRLSREETHLAAAETLFKKAIELDPDFVEAHASLCGTYLEWYELERNVARYKEAEEACIRALETGVSAAQVYVALGNLYRYNGDYERAYESFWRAAEIDNAKADAYIGSAEVLALMDRSAEAESSYRRAIDLEPGDWRAYNAYGDFLFDAGRFDEAEMQFSEVVSLMPDNPHGYNNLGGVHYMQGRFAEAAGDFEQSLALTPGRGAYSNTGTMYFYAGEYEKAAGHYRAALEFAPADFRMWGHLAEALSAMSAPESKDAYATAAQRAEDVLLVNDADAEARSRLAYFLSRLGQHAKALRQIAIALAAAPKNMYVQYDAALVFATTGDEIEALAAVQRAVDLGFPRPLLPVEPGLGAIRDNERFKQIVIAEASPE